MNDFRGYGKIERRILPLIFCWDVTVHELQGATLDSAVIHYDNKLFAKGQAYVDFSSIRNLSGTAISVLEPKKFLLSPQDRNCFKELERLKNA